MLVKGYCADCNRTQSWAHFSMLPIPPCQACGGPVIPTAKKTARGWRKWVASKEQRTRTATASGDPRRSRSPRVLGLHLPSFT